MSRRRIPTDLSWEQKNPTYYLYRPSKAIIRLERMGDRELWSSPEIKHSRRSRQHSFSGRIVEKKVGKVKRTKPVQKY